MSTDFTRGLIFGSLLATAIIGLLTSFGVGC